MKLDTTRLVLNKYQFKYPLFSPATIYDALESDVVQGSIDLFQLSELLSALLDDLEKENE